MRDPENKAAYVLGMRSLRSWSLDHREIHERMKNAVYRSQISVFVPEIFKFEKCVKYANEMTDDVIHSTQCCIKYINKAI